jgi:acetyltransferase
MTMKTEGLDAFFTAKSIAVVGASNHREKVGHQLLRNLQIANEEYVTTHRHDRFTLYPINPSSTSILGLPVFTSLRAIQEPVHMVIIATPVQTVATLIDEIIERNRKFADAADITKAVIIISAGFAETNKEGKELQYVIATKLAVAGIALLGPNSLGLINPHEYMNASFAQHYIAAGNLALISQSGAILTSLFDALKDYKCGVSFAISLGNKAGLTENECLEFAYHDLHTEVVVLYLESFSNLPQFFALVSKVRKKKPVIVLKGGTSERGQQASASHTAALATNQVLLQAAAEQMGFTLVENIEELLQLMFFLSRHQHLPENIMVITNAGGPAVNTIDELAKAGVPLAEWSKKSLADLENLLPNIAPHNPLDLLGDASPERYKFAVEVAQHDTSIDALLVIATPQAMTDMPGIVSILSASAGKKPLFVAMIGGEHLEKFRSELRAQNILCSDFPGSAITTMAKLQKIARTKYSPETFAPSALHHELHTAHQKLEPIFLPTLPPNLAETFQLLSRYDFQLPEYFLITDHNVDKLEHLKYPLFAKTANLSLLHKKKVGGVYGVVGGAREARAAYSQLQQFGNEVLFQACLTIDHELLLGANNDPQFGLYLTVGLGGSYTNLLADRSYAFLPASHAELKKAWESTKAFQALADQKSISTEVLKHMTQMQKLLLENPWIKSLEINPLVINEDGVWTTDVKIGV